MTLDPFGLRGAVLVRESIWVPGLFICVVVAVNGEGIRRNHGSRTEHGRFLTILDDEGVLRKKFLKNDVIDSLLTEPGSADGWSVVSWG